VDLQESLGSERLLGAAVVVFPVLESQAGQFLQEAGFLRTDRVEKEGNHPEEGPPVRIPRVGIWTLIYCQGAMNTGSAPTSTRSDSCCCHEMDQVIKENTPQEPKPNNPKQHEFGEPLPRSPRQLKRAQNRLKYEMNFEAQEGDKMNPVTKEPV
jgi:hypothetical protein